MLHTTRSKPTKAQAEWMRLRRQTANPRPHKYHAKPTVVDGHRFDSKAEADIYEELKMLERARQISHFELQPIFSFPMGFTYRADFRVFCTDGTEEIWDVKGVETPVFRLKAKCFRHFYPNLRLVIVKVNGPLSGRELP